MLPKINRKWRIPSNFHWWITCRHWTEHECVLQRENKRPAGWSAQPVSIRTHNHTLFIYTDFFSICWGSGFSPGSRTVSTQINMGDGGLENWGYFTRPSMIRDQMTCLWVSAPTRSVLGDLCALLWFYTGYVRLCYEKGAMSSCWKYAGFCGYFSFLSRLSFWLFLGSFLLLNYFAFLEKYCWPLFH